MQSPVDAINAAVIAAGFVHYRIARTEQTPHMYDGIRYVAVVLAYDTAQITNLRRAVAQMMGALPDFALLTGFIAAKSYYAVIIDIAPNALSKAAVRSTAPALPASRNISGNGIVSGNANGHSQNGVKRMTKLDFQDLPKAIKSFEHWLTDVGRQYLTHSDEELEDYELDSQGEDTSELVIYMRSDEHRFTSKYIVGFDKSLAVIDITNATRDDCAECMAEARDAWPEPPY